MPGTKIERRKAENYPIQKTQNLQRMQSIQGAQEVRKIK